MQKKGMRKMLAALFIAALMLGSSLTAWGAEIIEAAEAAKAIETIEDAAAGRTFTEEQKAQFTAGAKARLEQALANGQVTQAQFDEMVTAIERGEWPFAAKADKTREERKAAIESMKAKWDALTDAQKKEIYKLYDQRADISRKLVEKYQEFGIIDADAAAKIKDHIENQRKHIREYSKMPLFGGKFFKHDKSDRSKTD